MCYGGIGAAQLHDCEMLSGQITVNQAQNPSLGFGSKHAEFYSAWACESEKLLLFCPDEDAGVTWRLLPRAG